MWFGTQDGLNRYDGYKFRIFRNDPSDKNSISGNGISCMLETRDGDIWVGTATEGLNRYNRSKDTFTKFRHDKNNPNSISSNIIRSLFEDHNGDLWICTTYGGLNKFIREDNSFIHFTKEDDNPDNPNLNVKRVRHLIEDKEHNFWIATWGEGVKKYDRQNNKYISYKNKSNLNPNSNRINSLYEDSNGNIWAASNDGLQKLNKKTGEIKEYKHNANDEFSISNNFLSMIFEDSKGSLWIGTKECGLNKFFPETEEFISYRYNQNDPDSISNDSVYSICEDRSGLIWVGTNGSGLSRFSIEKKPVTHIKKIQGRENDLSSNSIYGFCEENKNTLWIATVDAGLNKLCFKENKFTIYRHNEIDKNSIGNDRISEIIFDKRKNLWAACVGGGISKFNEKEETFTTYKKSDDNKINSISVNTVYDIKEDNEGLIWIATSDGGVNKFDPEKEIFTHYRHNPENPDSIGSDRLKALFIDRNRYIWAGLEVEGLNKFDPETEKFTHYKNDPDNKNSLSNNSVLSILEDNSGRLWIGTFGGGLNYFDREKNIFINYQEKDGLPNNTINGILEDDNGFIWVSTNNGLSKFDPENKVFINYDVRDGLQSNEFNHSACLKLSGGELVFGGINGFNIFHPDEFKINKHIPEIVITDFQIFNKQVLISEKGSPLKKTINTTDEIKLSFSDSVFSFEFTSLDFNIPGKNQYAYMMEGFDKDWVYSGNRRFATYTNLNPGEYIFRVKGSNNDGIWNENGKSIKLTITPPFWKTLWFKGLSALTAAGIVRNIYQNKINEVKKEKKAQEDFTRKLLETQEDDRKRIAGELHDSIGNDLLITKNKLQLTLKNNSDIDSITSDVESVTEILSSTINEVREISYNLHPYQIERLGLTKAIQSIIDRTTNSTTLKFISHVDIIDKKLTPDTEISLFRIIQECINNIVKHSSAEEVIVNIKKGDENISIFISDNGKGFSPDIIKANSGNYGFGLKGMNERVKLFKGKFDINSIPGSGTDINIVIPLKQKSEN